ncbi:UDP-N-acetylglucosamine 2-epimerase [Leptospira adleri]|uniref:UDP-N-acetylglucosamine 2-epimerase (Hydrolyzing) n=1 Tax=Leptospira adleri TaxID=2023186 RepID=A0A2M9YPE1_9LEPT|nr:UDP-N-acetylglucosamine 2-epimerase [Leptospira adleri]PJZ53388.1 UDP-N-acetylglucosamine 2-epimerase (hydrolyzing) [Leptospira adleri]PJZ61831.1 UDP-N-acetylglucosamine 2-epimerase (hydrolyzing) [Leptospira adleri]
MKKKKVCVITGTRAEYGLLRFVMDEIAKSDLLELQLIVTGMHLSPEFGLTFREIENDGFFIHKRVEMLLSADTSTSITKSIGLGIIGFADAITDLKPDLILLLGDRFEILAAATAALISLIPIVHLHGGEITEGAFDESIRHSVTKMSHVHFVAAEVYRKRVIQLGEDPKYVFNVGGLGIDSIQKTQLLDKLELEQAMNFRFGQKNLLITYHPATLNEKTSEKHFYNLLEALEELKDTHLIFTLPNSDTGSRNIIEMIHEFVSKHPNSKAFTSLGSLKYFSCLQFIDGVVGNSSSGLIEVPHFKKGTVNIGDRQKGRLKATSVIDSAPDKNSILNSILLLYDPEFSKSLMTVSNPYGNGGASEKIVRILEALELSNLVSKKFNDIEFKC